MFFSLSGIGRNPKHFHKWGFLRADSFSRVTVNMSGSELCRWNASPIALVLSTFSWSPNTNSYSCTISQTPQKGGISLIRWENFFFSSNTYGKGSNNESPVLIFLDAPQFIRCSYRLPKRPIRIPKISINFEVSRFGMQAFLAFEGTPDIRLDIKEEIPMRQFELRINKSVRCWPCHIYLAALFLFTFTNVN